MLLSEAMVDIRPMKEIDPRRYNVLQRMTREFIQRAGGLTPRPNGSSKANPDRGGDKSEQKMEAAQWKLARAKTAEKQKLEEAFSSEDSTEYVVWEACEPSAKLNLVMEPLTVQLGEICPQLAQLSTS